MAPEFITKSVLPFQTNFFSEIKSTISFVRRGVFKIESQKILRQLFYVSKRMPSRALNSFFP